MTQQICYRKPEGYWKSALWWGLGVGAFVQLLADNYKDDNEKLKRGEASLT